MRAEKSPGVESGAIHQQGGQALPVPSVPSGGAVYAEAFDLYRDAGWLGVLPIPPRQKKPVPSGYTGRDGAWPSYSDVYDWAETFPDGNIALRLPAGVIGIDVDHYGGKDGGGTLAALQDAYGPLPETWRTGSRADGVSGIRLYQVPEGLRWPGDLGNGIEVIQTRHRYAVVWPSVHPNGGTYRWTGPDGVTRASGVPTPADLAPLPQSWVDALTSGAPERDVTAANLDLAAVNAWLGAHGTGEPCRRMAHAAQGYAAALALGKRSRHDAAMDAAMGVCHLAAEGHNGALEALGVVRTAFLDAVAGDRTREEAAAEWDRLQDGAVNIAAAGSVATADPCADPLTQLDGLIMPEDRAAALAVPAPVLEAAPAVVEVPGVVERVLPVVDWADRWDRPIIQEWIVEPILPARRLVALYSPPKMGKSLLMLEIAAAVASGREVLGTVPAPRRVLYVDFENDIDADVIPRLKAMGYQAADLGRLDYLSFPSMAALDTERGSLELMAALDTYRSEVVVVDTVSRAVEGLENENDTWLNFYRHTGLKLKQRGVSLVRLDHSGKDETKGQRGGSAKSGDVDAVWRLSTVVQDKTFRLDCEAARMPITEKTLIFERLQNPLRHKVEGAGPVAAFRHKEAAVVAFMDQEDLPRDTGRKTLRAALAGSGITASNNVLDAAIKARRDRHGMPVQDSLEGLI
ncbi:AAA family ATPase [Pseudarthrobacter sp. WHRI 8279]|uniref:AAA family ATPase n=1 Tax=Pseudarthrobacter sp. WHRI 8279 TaxID=3162566 RepID=UPI0032F02ACC